jgi:integrase
MYRMVIPGSLWPRSFMSAGMIAPELRAGVGLPALMNLLGHVDPDMTMRYLDVTLTDLKREFELARLKPAI